MKSYTEKLHYELLEKLEELDRNYNPKNLADPRLGTIKATLDQICENLKSYSFASIQEEVYYFKFVLPPTLALYIYYEDKIEWDRITRQGSPECQYKFNDRIYSQAESFRQEHKPFCDYYRDGLTGMDNFFFLRNSPVNHESKYPVGCIVDPASPPLHCRLLARLIAWTRLEQEVKISLPENMEKDLSVIQEEERLQWTGTKVNATELIYALKHSGLIENGNASVNRITNCFEKAFSINLGNTSKQFQEVLRRKMENGSIVDKLKDSLRKAIEEIEKEWSRKKRPPFGSPGLH